MDGILKGLNNAQRAAVTSPASVLQVLAPPGSGKTKTLTTRVAYHISHQHLKPWNIIVCTFTRKAAEEMKDRIRSFVGDELAKQLKLGTFHSISIRYLRQYGQYIGLDKDFGIADTADSKAIVKGQARGRISANKAKGVDSEQFLRTVKSVEQQEFAAVYQQYEATLKASNLLDYDDLLLRCCSLLRAYPQCVSNVEALLIDEFQDTNSIQYDLMGLFAQQRNAITIVGDPDQSIYGFRSAEIKNLTLMRQRWPDTITINLEENYRSSGAILHAAQHIIEQDETRPPKRLQATRSFGLRPVLRKLASAAAEADWLVSEVKRMEALSGNLLQPSDFAVLLRSSNLSRAIETALGKAGVPYRMIGGQRFYDRLEIKLLVDYLRVIALPDNSEAVERIINTPARRVGPETVTNLLQESQTKRVSLWRLILDIVQGRCKAKTKVTKSTETGLASFVNIILSCRKRIAASESEQASLIDLLNILLQKLSFQTYLKQKFPDDHEARWTNIEELMAQAADASDPQRLSAQREEDSLPAIEGLEQRTELDSGDVLSLFLANIALTTTSAEKAEQDGEPLQQLTISTIHAAKGLEWPVVFVPACYDGSIPHSRADDNDEERRLLYVGMTRAQALLYLSCPIKNTQREETSLSSFLAQPGVSSFFEEHGPSISPRCVADLAATLRRDCPSAAQLASAKSSIDRYEDNYWPLNGEEAAQEIAKWDYGKTSVSTTSFMPASTTMQQLGDQSTAALMTKPGFISVAARYDELMEQSRLKVVDKRAEKTETAQKPRGQKRLAEPKGGIANFFKKPCVQATQPKTVSEQPDISALRSSASARLSREPLSEVSNVQAVSPMLLRKPLAKPAKPQLQSASFADADNNRYVFLSSPPDDADEKQDKPSPDYAGPDAESKDRDIAPEVRSRPAATLHTTSMQMAAPHRKTLGMRRSIQGQWKPRSYQ